MEATLEQELDITPPPSPYNGSQSSISTSFDIASCVPLEDLYLDAHFKCVYFGKVMQTRRDLQTDLLFALAKEGEGDVIYLLLKNAFITEIPPALLHQFVYAPRKGGKELFQFIAEELMNKFEKHGNDEEKTSLQYSLKHLDRHMLQEIGKINNVSLDEAAFMYMKDIVLSYIL